MDAGAHRGRHDPRAAWFIVEERGTCNPCRCTVRSADSIYKIARVARLDDKIRGASTFR